MYDCCTNCSCYRHVLCWPTLIVRFNNKRWNNSNIGHNISPSTIKKDGFMFIVTQYKYTILKCNTLSTLYEHLPRTWLHAFAGFFENKCTWLANVQVDGEGSSTSCYDSVVKYLLWSCRGTSLRAQTKKTAKKWPKLHSSPLKGTGDGPLIGLLHVTPSG